MSDTLYSILKPGVRLDLGTFHFSAEDIKAFARKFDPQRFHVDEAAAEASHFGKLCASGWHTCAGYMAVNVRNYERAMREATGWTGPMPKMGVSPGVGDIRWHRATYAGDTLAYVTTVEKTRLSKSRPGWGIVTSRVSASNQDGAEVMSMTGNVFMSVES